MECRTGLCGRTGLTSGADEFVFTDLDVQGVPVLRRGDHGNAVSFPAAHTSYVNLRWAVRKVVCSVYISGYFQL